MGEQSKKLGVMMLAALVVSAMVGGGIFSLPQNMSQGAGAGAVLIAWIITGVGIFFLANTFRILADARPDATTGIYAYARLGFGRFAGFQMAWCYWLCNVFGNVAYAVPRGWKRLRLFSLDQRCLNVRTRRIDLVEIMAL